MILNLPEKELWARGHKACAGCGSSLAMRYALKAAGPNTIVVQATGCMEVVSTPYPETSWEVPYIHGAFENAAAIASGVWRALKKLNKTDINVLAIGGDGGTFDIGIQALSGAFERGENITYLCNDNEAYQNTGIQRSSATPKYADTTTTPAGSKIHGKTENAKNMPFIMAAHGTYVATVNVAFPQDFVRIMKKALEIKGPAYVQAFCPCQPGWKHDPSETINIAKLAFQSKANQLFEIENGVVTITKKPTVVKPVIEYLKTQGRFKHLRPDELIEIQKNVDANWERLLKLEESKIKIF